MIFEDLDDVAIAIHDMAMDGDNAKAAFGRLGKVTFIPAVEWCKDEVENKGTESHYILGALIQV